MIRYHAQNTIHALIHYSCYVARGLLMTLMMTVQKEEGVVKGRRAFLVDEYFGAITDHQSHINI